MASIADNVAAIIKLYPPARDDNNLLVALYWQVFDGLAIPGELANRIADSTSVESIVRARREVIEQEAQHLENKSKLEEMLKQMEVSSNGTTKSSKKAD